MVSCFFAQARNLDDHISPANIVAEGVVEACARPIYAQKQLSEQGLRTVAGQQAADRMVDNEAEQAATEVVLKLRASHSAQ